MPLKPLHPINTLIQQYLSKPSYHIYWKKNIIRKAWDKLLPHTQLQKFFLKEKTLYIKFDSNVLTHLLQVNKKDLITKLTQKIKALSLGAKEPILNKIIFL